MGTQRCLLSCKGTARNSLICSCVLTSSLFAKWWYMCKQVPNPFLWHILLCNVYVVKAAFTHFIPFIYFFVFIWNFIYNSLSYISSSPRGNHHAKSVTYSYFEVSNCKCSSTLHKKAVISPEYTVIQIALLTLRKLIYRDCVSNSKMLVYILIC